jgi:hypothetical protein
VFAVLTMRTTSGPTPFDRLVKDGHLRCLGVDPLKGASVETLLHRALGGSLVAESLDRLRDAAMGNPGVLRQLVESARDAGTLREHDGVWRLVGPRQPTLSFEELVAERLSGLDDVHHHSISLCGLPWRSPLTRRTTRTSPRPDRGPATRWPWSGHAA